jgi:hypothetical protein
VINLLTDILIVGSWIGVIGWVAWIVDIISTAIKQKSKLQFYNPTAKITKHKETFVLGIILWTFMVIAPIFLPLQNQLSDKQIGSALEGKNYSALYYVNLFPDDSSVKNYRVYGEVERKDGVYSINKIYFSKKKYLMVYDVEDKIQINEKVRFEDQDEKHWEMELTNVMADKIPE